MEELSLPLERRTETTWVHLDEAPLSVADAYAFLPTDYTGGIDLFVGTTRRFTDERETVRLAYEAYAPMAAREMERLAEEAIERWPVRRACLLHRLGEVPPGEASVIIGVATPHRADAFAACRFLIDALKAQVPIWKKEVYADGSTEWVEGQRPALRGKDERKNG